MSVTITITSVSDSVKSLEVVLLTLQALHLVLQLCDVHLGLLDVGVTGRALKWDANSVTGANVFYGRTNNVYQMSDHYGSYGNTKWSTLA